MKARARSFRNRGTALVAQAFLPVQATEHRQECLRRQFQPFEVRDRESHVRNQVVYEGEANDEQEQDEPRLKQDAVGFAVARRRRFGNGRRMSRLGHGLASGRPSIIGPPRLEFQVNAATQARFASGTYGTSVLPTEICSGRKMRLPTSCSCQWASQPATRPIAKIGVNTSVGIPIAWYTTPE